MNSRVTLPIAVVVGLVAIGLLQPILLLAVSHISAGVPIDSAPALSTVMAAVFTVGGLVIALVSVVTLMRIEGVVDDSLKRALATVPATVSERIEHVLSAYTLLIDAKDRWGDGGFRWMNQIENDISAAEAVEPDMIQLRRFAAQYYLTAARAGYAAHRIRSAGYMAPMPADEDVGRYASLAIARLRSLFDTEADDTERAAAGWYLAQATALLNEAPRKVARWLTESNYLHKLPPPDSLTMLCLLASCRNAHDLHVVLEPLHRQPLTVEQIKASLNAAPQQGIVGFVALTINGVGLQDMPFSPGVISFAGVENFARGYLRWDSTRSVPVGFLYGAWPAMGEYNQGGQATPEPIPIDDLLDEALKHFIFVTPFLYEQPTSLTF